MIFKWLSEKVPVTSFVKKRMNGDMLIVCSDSLALYYFNSTAAFFLNSINGKLTVNEIKKIFLEKYDVEEKNLESDLVEIIRELQWKKILKMRDDNERSV